MNFKTQTNELGLKVYPHPVTLEDHEKFLKKWQGRLRYDKRHKQKIYKLTKLVVQMIKTEIKRLKNIS